MTVIIVLGVSQASIKFHPNITLSINLTSLSMIMIGLLRKNFYCSKDSKSILLSIKDMDLEIGVKLLISLAPIRPERIFKIIILMFILRLKILSQYIFINQ